MINHVKISKRTFDEGFRMEYIIWLAACNDGEGFIDLFREDFLDDPDNWQAFGEPFPDHIDPAATAALAERLIDMGKLGFLAKFEAQVPVAADDISFKTLGWGLCRIFWVYAETPNELIEKASQQVNTWLEKKLAELRAADKVGSS